MRGMWFVAGRNEEEDLILTNMAWCSTCGEDCHLDDLDDSWDCPKCQQWWKDNPPEPKEEDMKIVIHIDYDDERKGIQFQAEGSETEAESMLACANDMAQTELGIEPYWKQLAKKEGWI